MSTSFEDLERRLATLEDIIERGPEAWSPKGSAWVTATTNTLQEIKKTQADHTFMLNGHTQRLQRIEENALGIKTELERLTTAVERLSGPGEPGTPGPG